MRAAVLAGIIALATAGTSSADEGGASLYLSGSYGSLAAVPGVPGWSWAFVYYHADASLTMPALGTVTARSDIGYGVLTYTFAPPVLGGQLALSLVGSAGKVTDSVPGEVDSRWGYNDLVPSAALRWNRGVDNYMAYVQAEVPVGTYDATRLANFGLGHWGIDGGVGYTYYDADKGNELSAVAGVTYNFDNPHTHYRNGVDVHLDWGASKFVSDSVQLGAVGYWYGQLTSDRGPSLDGGNFKSRIAGIGPQAGFLFPVGQMQGYLNIKAYKEFAEQNRPGGWNAWIVLSISPKAP